VVGYGGINMRVNWHEKIGRYDRAYIAFEVGGRYESFEALFWSGWHCINS
jgi:hypothetical protein